MTTKKQSKRLSYILRHAPEEAGLTFEDGGWVLIEDLLRGLDEKGWGISLEELISIVETNDKKRFTISEDGLRIRAAQGHSMKIKSDLEPVTPPPILYHGTAKQTLDVIMSDGLKPMSRQHVHLSLDKDTALKVGQRHGKPIVLEVAAANMASHGYEFYCADNGVWLTAAVPSKYLSL